MSIFICLSFLLFYEYICDFILQSREVAENKTKDIKALGIHLSSFLLLLIPLFLMGYTLSVALTFVLMYALIHGLIDMSLWGFYRKSAEKRKIKEYWNDKEFYDFIGLDRYLHIVSFILLYSVYLV